MGGGGWLSGLKCQCGCTLMFFVLFCFVFVFFYTLCYEFFLGPLHWWFSQIKIALIHSSILDICAYFCHSTNILLRRNSEVVKIYHFYMWNYGLDTCGGYMCMVSYVCVYVCVCVYVYVCACARTCAYGKSFIFYSLRWYRHKVLFSMALDKILTTKQIDSNTAVSDNGSLLLSFKVLARHTPCAEQQLTSKWIQTYPCQLWSFWREQVFS